MFEYLQYMRTDGFSKDVLTCERALLHFDGYGPGKTGFVDVFKAQCTPCILLRGVIKSG